MYTLAHTRTHARTHMQSILSLYMSATYCYGHILTHTHTRMLKYIHTCTCTHTHTLTHTLSVSHTHTHFLSLSLSLWLHRNYINPAASTGQVLAESLNVCRCSSRWPAWRWGAVRWGACSSRSRWAGGPGEGLAPGRPSPPTSGNDACPH